MNFFGSGNQMKRKAVNLKSVKREIVQHTSKKCKYDETKPVVTNAVNKKKRKQSPSSSAKSIKKIGGLGCHNQKSLTMFFKKKK
jgi:hypothetical protein